MPPVILWSGHNKNMNGLYHNKQYRTWSFWWFRTRTKYLSINVNYSSIYRYRFKKLNRCELQFSDINKWKDGLANRLKQARPPDISVVTMRTWWTFLFEGRQFSKGRHNNMQRNSSDLLTIVNYRYTICIHVSVYGFS